MTKLVIDGDVERPAQLTYADLCQFDASFQIADVSQIDPKRAGSAVRLEGILQRVAPRETVKYITIHASQDDFHASVPLAEIRDRAILIYSQKGAALEAKSGGPVRFYIRDFGACHSQEIDECANVKFVDRLEFSAEKGLDNRPHDGAEHEALHRG